MESNYEKQVYIARELFLKYDQEEIIRKYRLAHDEEWLYLRFLDRDYRISRGSGEISYRRSGSDPGGADEYLCERTDHAENYEICLDFSVVMSIYDVLCCSKAMPVLSHEWCPVAGLQVTMSSPGTDSFTDRYAKRFSGKADLLLRACKKIGGEQPQVRAGADVCWQFPLFPFLPVQMRFWDGDDEFEPKILLLWDKKTQDFIHFETTYYAQGYLLERLAELVDQ